MKLDFVNNNLNRFDFLDGISTGADVAAPGLGQAVKPIANFLTSLFGGGPNPNDWQGWNAQDAQAGRPIGSSAVWWTITDGDSVKNEADNVQSYIKNYPGGKGLEQLLIAAQDQYGKSSQEFLEALADKMKRAGNASQAASISSYIKTSPLTGSNAPAVVAQNGTLSTGPASNDVTQAQQNAQAANKKSTQIIVIAVAVVVVIALVAYLIVRKK